jgi:hypothetical protein
MSDKLTKKELQAKIVDLEKELDIWKTKTQLARNYNILKTENDTLVQKLHKKQEYWKEWAKEQS